jgi:hypothetical protein
MCVQVVYKGRLGNNLFQYIAARLFAEVNDLYLASSLPANDVIQCTPHKAGRIVCTPPVQITDQDDLFGRPWGLNSYSFNGYFQRSWWYHERRADILRFVELQPIPAVNRKDIVINLRVDEDYRSFNWVINPSWYLKILAEERFDRLHIVTDVRDEAYLSHFKQYDPIVVSSGPKGDWEYLRSFDRIVTANSTFSWWAAYFSQASRIYTFKRWVIHPDPQLQAFPNGVEIDGKFLHEG